MQVWDNTIKDELKELIATTYTNNMHILFNSLSLNNYIVKLLDLK